MLDKDKPTNKTPEKSTDEKKVLVVENTPKKSSGPSTAKKASNRQSDSIKNQEPKSQGVKSTAATSSDKSITAPATSTKQKVSKLAVLALCVSAVAIAASVGHYVWQQQQASNNIVVQHDKTTQILQTHKQQLESQLTSAFSVPLKDQLQKHQHYFSNQLEQYTQQAAQKNQEEVKQLTDKVTLLEQSITQRDSSDWLVHEAEYLIRVAARTMWLEQDTRAAIGLLKEADNRLSELKQPKFLPIRALIHQDIEALALMPILDNHNAVLGLMALNKQITTLPLAGVNLAKALNANEKENLELSDDISDWQSNLSKTWNKFLSDFITVRRRAGDVEPLMAPEQQQHLKQNLSLKVQLAQWAASEQRPKIYQQTLLDIQESLNEFFDMDATANKNFYQALEQAKQHIVSYNYPSDLTSLGALTQLMKKQQPATITHSNKALIEADSISPTEQLIEQLTDKVTDKPSQDNSEGNL
jgi:uroporphyrin-3 C-methyltransferase